MHINKNISINVPEFDNKLFSICKKKKHLDSRHESQEDEITDISILTLWLRASGSGCVGMTMTMTMMMVRKMMMMISTIWNHNISEPRSSCQLIAA